jgi:hypothetical protein
MRTYHVRLQWDGRRAWLDGAVLDPSISQRHECYNERGVDWGEANDGATQLV